MPQLEPKGFVEHNPSIKIEVEDFDMSRIQDLTADKFALDLESPQQTLRHPQQTLRHPDQTLRHLDQTLRHPDQTLRHLDQTLRHLDQTLRHPDQTLRHPELAEGQDFTIWSTQTEFREVKNIVPPIKGVNPPA